MAALRETRSLEVELRIEARKDYWANALIAANENPEPLQQHFYLEMAYLGSLRGEIRREHPKVIDLRSGEASEVRALLHDRPRQPDRVAQGP